MAGLKETIQTIDSLIDLTDHAHEVEQDEGSLAFHALETMQSALAMLKMQADRYIEGLEKAILGLEKKAGYKPIKARII